jgi:hypothetical protein
MKYTLVITGLLLLVVANVLIVMRFSSGLGFREGFQQNGMNNSVRMNNSSNIPMGFNYPPPPTGGMPTDSEMNGVNSSEGFTSYLLENAAGSKGDYKAMGAYDGVQLSTGNSTSVWRYTAPNEKLLGDEFAPGDDSLFMFKNNQCKPECCGSSFSCGGGCVCTTPQQREYLAGRGGNRTGPEDSA